jgi:hypothetical protein
MTLYFLYENFKAIMTSYHSDYNRMQQYAIEVKYLKYQSEGKSLNFEPTKGFTKCA